MDEQSWNNKADTELHECDCCHEERLCKFGPNPHALEIFGNDEEEWICIDCFFNAVDDI